MKDSRRKTVNRNEACPCGSGKKYKRCCLQKAKTSIKPYQNQIILKNEHQIQGIRKSSQLTKKILDMLEERVVEGITTNQINDWVHQYTIEHGATPAPLNYRGASKIPFPKSICTSLNHVICHGIPDQTVLKQGDILNIDVTCNLNGFYGDASRMYLIGEVSDEARRLCEVTKECLKLGLEQVVPGNSTENIGRAIQEHAESHGYSVVRAFCGHGVGVQFHEPPQILHYYQKNSGVEIVPNMVFTIEPMINLGRHECRLLSDGWTAVTADGSLSAQWEHTVLATTNGYDILTT